MGVFARGDIVIIPFPFSNLSNSKLRPALVVAKLKGNDVILCQITSKNRADGYSISLTNGDFVAGGLQLDSNIRPSALFTGDTQIIRKTVGKLNQAKINEVINKVKEILDN